MRISARSWLSWFHGSIARNACPSQTYVITSSSAIGCSAVVERKNAWKIITRISPQNTCVPSPASAAALYWSIALNCALNTAQ